MSDVKSPVEMTCTVLGVKPLGGEVHEVKLQAPAGQRFEFTAGQYLEVLLDGRANVPYSIASVPGEDTLVLHVAYQGKETLSLQVLEHFRNNAEVQVKLPMGQAVLTPEQLNNDGCLILVAAGSCFGQMKSILEYALSQHCQRQIYLYWGVRNAEQLYLREEAEAWRQHHANVHFVPVVSEPHANWHGRVCLVHQAILDDLGTALPEAEVYVCGSPAMVYSVEKDFLAAGMQEGAMYSDVFAYAPRP